MAGLGLMVVVVLASLVMAGSLYLLPSRGVQIGTSILLLYVLLARLIFTGEHQLALWHLAHHEYELAIPRFEASFEYFTRHTWLDRLRYMVMLSPAGYRYREMAMLGLGYCHAQLGRVEAQRWYEGALREYPDNSLAKAALVLMRAGAMLAQRTPIEMEN